MTKKIIFALVFSLMFAVSSHASKTENFKNKLTTHKVVSKNNNFKKNKPIATINKNNTDTKTQILLNKENIFLKSTNNLEKSELCLMDQQRSSVFVKSHGFIKGLVIFAGFSNLPVTEVEKNEWEKVQIPNFNNFFSLSSYNNLKTYVEIFQNSFQLPNSTGYYGLDVNNHSSAKIHQLSDDILNIADSEIDFSLYDFISLVYPSTINTVAGAIGGTYRDGKRFNGMISGSVKEYLNQPNKKYWFVHEFSHLLGLPHYFDETKIPKEAYTNLDISKMYSFDVMRGGTETNPDLFSWIKFYLGWINKSQIDCINANSNKKTLHHLTSLLINDTNTKSVVIKENDKVAYFIEHRSSNEIDRMESSESGIYIYKLDLTSGGIESDKEVDIIYLLKADVNKFENNLFTLRVLQQNEIETYLEIEVKNG
jgi:M6 family metalloprotease-like protein